MESKLLIVTFKECNKLKHVLAFCITFLERFSIFYLFVIYLDTIYIMGCFYLSFFPNKEKCTYLLGCIFKSSNRLAALDVVAFKL